MRSFGGNGSGLKAAVVLLICSLGLSGCGNKTTLDRIGAITVTAVNAYLIEIDQLFYSNNLSQEKYNQLKAKGEIARTAAERFARELQVFGEINPKNVAQLTQQFASATGLLRNTLVEAGLDPKSRPVRILSYAIETLVAASIVISGIHPDPVVTLNRNTGNARNNPRPSAVQVTLPKADKDVEAAMREVGKRIVFISPEGVETYGMDELLLPQGKPGQVLIANDNGKHEWMHPCELEHGPQIALDPKDFGAKGDGKTDDYAAFQRMVKALKPCGVIDGQMREYFVSKPVRLPNVPITFGWYKIKGRPIPWPFEWSEDQWDAPKKGSEAPTVTLTGGGGSGASSPGTPRYCREWYRQGKSWQCAEWLYDAEPRGLVVAR